MHTQSKHVELLANSETASISLCGIAMLSMDEYRHIYSRGLGRSICSENNLCFVCHLSNLLFSLHYLGGELWGSRNVALPFALTALIVLLLLDL